MIKKIPVLLAMAPVILLAGCASTTIYPESSGTYSLVATSSQQAYAEKAAVRKATAYCQKMGKNLVVVNHKTVYQGVNKRDAAIINLASDVLAHGSNPANSSNNYQVTMKFKCK